MWEIIDLGVVERGGGGVGGGIKHKGGDWKTQSKV